MRYICSRFLRSIILNIVFLVVSPSCACGATLRQGDFSSFKSLGLRSTRSLPCPCLFFTFTVTPTGYECYEWDRCGALAQELQSSTCVAGCDTLVHSPLPIRQVGASDRARNLRRDRFRYPAGTSLHQLPPISVAGSSPLAAMSPIGHVAAAGLEPGTLAAAAKRVVR